MLNAAAATAATAAAGAHGGKIIRPAVVSRRAWKKLHDKLLAERKPQPSSSSGGTGKATTKVEDKPWPRSMQIAGYVSAGVAIPYFSLWLVTSNPTLRSWFGPFLPMDKLRSHYGHLESDAYSYVDLMDIEHPRSTTATKLQQKGNSGEGDDDVREVDIRFYRFPGEMPFRERLQEQMVETMNSMDIKARILVEDAAGTNQVDGHPAVVVAEETVSVPGSVSASQSSLKSLLKSPSIPNESSTMNIAVEFDEDDPNNEGHQGSSIIVDYGRNHRSLEEDQTGVGVDPREFTQDTGRALLQDTHTFSKWYSIPVATQQQQQQQQQGQQRSNSSREKRISDQTIEISRLEYTIAELQRNLKDPTCTRDIDDMVSELKQAKRQLSSIKWRQRLGW
jgi:hypothetical protein